MIFYRRLHVQTQFWNNKDSYFNLKNMGDSFLWKTGTSTPFFIFFNPN
jgi:hypothetical protein